MTYTAPPKAYETENCFPKTSKTSDTSASAPHKLIALYIKGVFKPFPFFDRRAVRTQLFHQLIRRAQALGSDFSLGNRWEYVDAADTSVFIRRGLLADHRNCPQSMLNLQRSADFQRCNAPHRAPRIIGSIKAWFNLQDVRFGAKGLTCHSCVGARSQFA